jgi:hypothetical protein
MGEQGVTKRCRPSCLTKAPSHMSPNAGGGKGGVAGSQLMRTPVHRSPNKLNLWGGAIASVFSDGDEEGKDPTTTTTKYIWPLPRANVSCGHLVTFDLGAQTPV